jgi:hypothetical protein
MGSSWNEVKTRDLCLLICSPVIFINFSGFYKFKVYFLPLQAVLVEYKFIYVQYIKKSVLF